MKNKTMSIFALGMIALLGVSFVAAYHGDSSVQGPNYSEERHEAMEAVFADLDYDAWVELMSEDGRHPRVLDVVTEDNFATFVEMHEAMEAGDFETADELRVDLGLGLGNGAGHGKGSGHGKGMGQGSGMRGMGQYGGECPYAN